MSDDRGWYLGIGMVIVVALVLALISWAASARSEMNACFMLCDGSIESFTSPTDTTPARCVCRP